jgi:hypothetical protein
MVIGLGDVKALELDNWTGLELGQRLDNWMEID